VPAQLSGQLWLRGTGEETLTPARRVIGVDSDFFFKLILQALQDKGFRP
jgi:hypothetical protein